MKKILKYFAAVSAGCIVLSSCDNDEYLTVTQYRILQPDVQFSTDANTLMGLNGIYTFNNVSDFDNSWGFKPNLFTGSHPTMDTQCTGWDVKFLDQTWDDSVGELGEGWSHAYAAISRANKFLEGLDNDAAPYNEFSKLGVTAACRKSAAGEAKALRGYFYTWLATTFGRVPMLETGEDYSNTPVKAAAETYEQMWDFIISDFKAAADSLDWLPYKGQYGRCTKGMALTYLADAYMWKAYRCPDQAAKLYADAKACLQQVYDKHDVYELSSNFATNWDPDGFWNKECIWAMVSDEGGQWSGWGGDRTITFCNPNMFKWFTACTENGGWGAEFLSWEWYSNYEHGDLRRDASCVTGEIPQADYDKWEIEKSEVVNGWHPYLQCHVGSDDASSTMRHFHNGQGELAPSIWTTKFWRTAYADGNSWGVAMWAPNIVYAKRLANVIIDLAECEFRVGDSNKGWALLDELRARAWGEKQAGQDYSKFTAHYNALYSTVGYDLKMETYPLVAADGVKAPSAQEYYTSTGRHAKANRKGYTHTSEPWKIAVNEERRKEFNSEWCLCPDMIRSGYMEDHINFNYPKDETAGDALRDYPWSHRVFDYNPDKMDMPIPAKEIIQNSALKQNPAYAGKE